MRVVQNHFYHAVKVITIRKNLFFEKINVLCNSVHLYPVANPGGGPGPPPPRNA